jgi:hypothetical protein
MQGDGDEGVYPGHQSSLELFGTEGVELALYQLSTL